MPFRSEQTRKDGFTLIEVMVSVVVVSLVITAGYTLIGVSLRMLAMVDTERALLSEAQKVYLDFLTKGDMADSGERQGESGSYTGVVKWSVETDSVPVVDELELTFRRLTVEIGDREIVLFLQSSQGLGEFDS
jgi:prepilin-type N-terminal cleavage/methylation domain-containing protein